MRKLLGLVAAGAIAFGVGAPASAAPVNATGTISIYVGTLPPITLNIPSAVVDVTGNTLSLPAGIASVTGMFVPVTGFPLNLITGIIVTASNGAGSFAVPGGADGGSANVPGGGFGGTMPINGVAQVKGALALNLPLSVIGVGGTTSAGGIIVDGAPWTTGAAMITTDGMNMSMFTNTQGGLAGALGALSSTVTLVTPAHVNAAGLTRLPVFAVAAIHTEGLPVPEPGTLLLLGAGLAGLGVVGRRARS